MVVEDFSNVYLKPHEKLSLRWIRFIRSAKYKSSLESLLDNRYIDFMEYETDEIGQRFPVGSKIKITEKGIAYLEYCGRSFVKDYLFEIVNFAVAVGALVVSIIALVQ